MSASGDATIDALPVQARQLLAGAWGFFFTARFAMVGHSQCEGQAPDIRPAVLVNVAYGYELSLKAVLAANGRDDGHLRRVSHDLNRALTEAVGFGLPASAVVSEEIRLLAVPFANHSLRYVSFGDLELSPNALAALEQHLGNVSALLLASSD